MKTTKIVWRFAPVLMVLACVGGAGRAGSSEVRERASGFESFRIAALNNPCCAPAHNNLGISYATAGQLDKARSELCRAVCLKPRKALYRNNLAAVLIDQGRYDWAFRQLLAVHGSAIGHYNLQYMLSLKFSDDSGETSLVTQLMGGRPAAGIRSASPSLVEVGPAPAPPKPIQWPSEEPIRIPRNVVQDANTDVQPQHEERDSSGPSSGVVPRNVVPQEERPRRGPELQSPQNVVPIRNLKTTLRFVIPLSASEEI